MDKMNELAEALCERWNRQMQGKQYSYDPETHTIVDEFEGFDFKRYLKDIVSAFNPDWECQVAKIRKILEEIPVPDCCPRHHPTKVSLAKGPSCPQPSIVGVRSACRWHTSR